MATPTSDGVVSNVPLTGQNRIDGLLADYKWGGGVGTAAHLTYSFRSSSSYYSTEVHEYGPSSGSGAPWKPGWYLLTDTQKIGIGNALNAWAEIANVGFTEVGDSSTVAGDIRFGTEPGITVSHAYHPWASATAGDVWFSTSSELNTSEKGTYGYATFLHEIGHALGLDHPHDGRVVANGSIDAVQFTIMSYRDFVGNAPDGYSSDFLPTTPMLNDIAAIQYLYGANNATRSGDTTYSWAVGQKIYETIWDGGGNDTIDWSNQSSAAAINLNAGKWSDIGPTRWDGHAYTPENLAIAYNVTIENAVGGGGADAIAGNGAANFLSGRAGRDSIRGGAGADSLYGGNGSDRLNGQAGDDTVQAGAGADRIDGGDGNDRLQGGAGNDRFDWAPSGRSGADTFVGGIGNDAYVTFGGDRIVESADAGTDTIWADATFSIAAVANVEKLFLFGTAPVSATGNSLGNELRGNDANNLLAGGAGSDRLTGHAGRDTFAFDTAPNASSNIDRITDFVVADDTIQLDRSIFGRVATGNLAADAFYTGAGVTAAHDGNDRIVYNTTTGNLYYDADGQGGNTARLFAALVDTPSITAADFFIVA